MTQRHHPPAGTVHAIVPAGGAGTRLWPLSRRRHPKFLADLTGTGASLLQQTLARLDGVAEHVTVVTGTAHVGAVSAQVRDRHLDGAVRVLAEPSPRDSMAAIGLAAALVEADALTTTGPGTGPDTIVGSFAADHVVTDVDAFHGAVRQAAALAATGLVATLGITPTAPSTAFGYIREAPTITPLAVDAPDARAVAAFVEKPDEATARRYLAAGGHWWNAGMFVARAGVLLDALARHRPDLAAGLRSIAARAAVGEDLPHVLDECWDGLEAVAIDHAVAEPAAAEGLVAVVPVEMGWDDLGDVAALARHLPSGVLGDAGLVHLLDAPGALVAPTGRDVVVLGIEDAVVLDTGDALLVTTRGAAQRVKDVTALLADEERDDLL